MSIPENRRPYREGRERNRSSSAVQPTPTTLVSAEEPVAGGAAEDEGVTTVIRDGTTYRFRPAATIPHDAFESSTINSKSESTSSTTSSSSATIPTTTPQPRPEVQPSTTTTQPVQPTTSRTADQASTQVVEPSSSSVEIIKSAASSSTSSTEIKTPAPSSSLANSEAVVESSTTSIPASTTSLAGTAQTSSSFSMVPAFSPSSSESASPSMIAPSILVLPTPITSATLSTSFNVRSSSSTTSSRQLSSSRIPLPSVSGISAAASKNDEGSGTNKGTAAGAIVGALFGLAALIVLILFAIRYYKRRKQSDREALMRSSWFYGGHVSMADDDEKSYRQRQSHFSAPSMYRKSTNRISSFAASVFGLHPLRGSKRNSSRFPRMSTMPRASQYYARTDVPRPPPAVPAGQGGWATRFFAGAPGGRDSVSYAPGYESMYDPGVVPITGKTAPLSIVRSQRPSPEPNIIPRESPAIRPAIQHPFAVSAESDEGSWGHSYSSPANQPDIHLISPSTASPPSASPRDMLQRNPPSSSSAYSGMAAHPIPTVGQSSPGMEILAASPPADLSTAPAKAAIIARLNNNTYTDSDRPTVYSDTSGFLLPPVNTAGPLMFAPDDLHTSSLFEYADKGQTPSRGISAVDSHSVYSTNSAYPRTSQGVSQYFLPSHDGRETLYSPGHVDRNQRYSAATTITRPSYYSTTSGIRANADAVGSRETREWMKQPEWDEGLARSASVARKSVKSVRWDDGLVVDDGQPRAL